MADIIHTAEFEEGLGDDEIKVLVTFDLENKAYKVKDMEGLDLRIEDYDQGKFDNLIELLTRIKTRGDNKFA